MSLLNHDTDGPPNDADERSRSSTFSVSNSIDDDLAGSSSRASRNPFVRNGGMVLLLVVVAVASALLFGMRKLGLAGRLELVDIKIDYPFESGKNTAAGPDHQVVIKDLRTSTDVRQVPPELVQMNPFEWMVQAQSTTTPDPKDDAVRRAREARRREIAEAFDALTLNSVMGGRMPVAQISGQLVRVGDDIGEFFTVLQIEGRSVVLVADDDKFTLTLGN